MNGILVEQNYWDASYTRLPLATASEDDPVRHWLRKFVPHGSGTCLEFGCFPGRYLAVLGELGYELHGIDLTPRAETELPAWLRLRGFRVGEIKRADIWQYEPNRTYEVVCSFGLIEHFVDWPRLIARHAGLVQEKGYLVISTPNFRGWIQRLLHLSLDLENYRRHNIAAMSPRCWGRMVAESGFRIIDCGWFGGFDFWADHQARNILQKAALKFIRRSLPRLKGLPANVPAYAPHCGLVAQKMPNETVR